MVNPRSFLRRGVLDVAEPKRRRLDNTEVVDALMRRMEKFEGQLSEHFIRRSSGYLMNTLREGSKGVNDIPGDLNWLKELHSKIWNRGNLKPELFRTVEVTRVDYDKLQHDLDQKISGRNLPGYDGSCNDVLSYKLDVLKRATPTNPQRANNDVDDGDDPEAIDSLFPSTLNYLDLSTVLKKKSGRFPLAIFIREEYNIITNLIKERPQDNKGSVIVSGQPGTGRVLVSLSRLAGSNQPCRYQGITTYLYLRIIEFLLEGRPFLFQTRRGIICYVTQKGVEAIPSSWSPETPIVAFVDADLGESEPNDVINDPLVQIIVASYPKGAYQPWIKQAPIITNLAMSLWSPGELYLTGLVLASFSERLADSFL